MVSALDFVALTAGLAVAFEADRLAVFAAVLGVADLVPVFFAAPVPFAALAALGAVLALAGALAEDLTAAFGLVAVLAGAFACVVLAGALAALEADFLTPPAVEPFAAVFVLAGAFAFVAVLGLAAVFGFAAGFDLEAALRFVADFFAFVTVDARATASGPRSGVAAGLPDPAAVDNVTGSAGALETAGAAAATGCVSEGPGEDAEAADPDDVSL